MTDAKEEVQAEAVAEEVQEEVEEEVAVGGAARKLLRADTCMCVGK